MTTRLLELAREWGVETRMVASLLGNGGQIVVQRPLNDIAHELLGKVGGGLAWNGEEETWTAAGHASETTWIRVFDNFVDAVCYMAERARR